MTRDTIRSTAFKMDKKKDIQIWMSFSFDVETDLICGGGLRFAYAPHSAHMPQLRRGVA